MILSPALAVVVGRLLMGPDHACSGGRPAYSAWLTRTSKAARARRLRGPLRLPHRGRPRGVRPRPPDTTPVAPATPATPAADVEASPTRPSPPADVAGLDEDLFDFDEVLGLENDPFDDGALDARPARSAPAPASVVSRPEEPAATASRHSPPRPNGPLPPPNRSPPPRRPAPSRRWRQPRLPRPSPRSSRPPRRCRPPRIARRRPRSLAGYAAPRPRPAPLAAQDVPDSSPGTTVA